jgi:hypothetical protein
MERLTAWPGDPDDRPPPDPLAVGRWTVDIGVTLILLDLLFWIRR